MEEESITDSLSKDYLDHRYLKDQRIGILEYKF